MRSPPRTARSVDQGDRQLIATRSPARLRQKPMRGPTTAHRATQRLARRVAARHRRGNALPGTHSPSTNFPTTIRHDPVMPLRNARHTRRSRSPGGRSGPSRAGGRGFDIHPPRRATAPAGPAGPGAAAWKMCDVMSVETDRPMPSRPRRHGTGRSRHGLTGHLAGSRGVPGSLGAPAPTLTGNIPHPLGVPVLCSGFLGLAGWLPDDTDARPDAAAVRHRGYGLLALPTDACVVGLRHRPSAGRARRLRRPADRRVRGCRAGYQRGPAAVRRARRRLRSSSTPIGTTDTATMPMRMSSMLSFTNATCPRK